MHAWNRDPKVSTDVPAVEHQRVLLGFMSEDAALRKLQSARTVGTPLDPLEGPDETPEESEYVALWEEAKSNIDDRRFDSSVVELRDVPDEDGVEAHVEAFLDDPLTRASLDHRAAATWRIKLVPIERLVSFQPSVTTTAYQDAVPATSDPVLDVLRYALPVEATPLVEDQEIWGEYFSGWQFVSRSPNFYVSGPHHSRPDTDDTVFAEVTFELEANPNFVSVGHFEDRYILRNGYHRTYQLWQAGHTHVPAVVVETESYDDAGASSSLFFDRDVVMADRPPMLPDYETPVATDVHRRAENHVVRIIAETTDVLR